jgi:hypothetical protein
MPQEEWTYSSSVDNQRACLEPRRIGWTFRSRLDFITHLFFRVDELDAV